MPPKKKKSLSVFIHDSKMKEDDKIVLQRVGFEISRERQGLLLQSSLYITEESKWVVLERNNFSLNFFDNSSFKVICSINICGDYFNQTLFNPEVTVLSGLKGDVPRDLN